MVHPVFDHLDRPIITDGGWGTALQARGLALGAAPDLWNLTHPDTVAAVAAAYVAAGAQIILTNTFGANRFRLAAAADRLGLINARGVALSRAAAGKQTLVFASMGPSGKRSGEVSNADLAAGFFEQAQAIATAKPDGIVIETMQDLEEAVIATAAAKATGLPVVVTMVFDSGLHRDRAGTTPEQAAAALVDAGADVIGANCGGIADLVAICARLKAAGQGRPIWIKASAGLPALENGKLIYAMTAQDFAAHAPDLVAAGASFIGGCCGAGPDFIAAVRASLRLK